MLLSVVTYPLLLELSCEAHLFGKFFSPATAGGDHHHRLLRDDLWRNALCQSRTPQPLLVLISGTQSYEGPVSWYSLTSGSKWPPRAPTSPLSWIRPRHGITRHRQTSDIMFPRHFQATGWVGGCYYACSRGAWIFSGWTRYVFVGWASRPSWGLARLTVIN